MQLLFLASKCWLPSANSSRALQPFFRNLLRVPKTGNNIILHISHSWLEISLSTSPFISIRWSWGIWEKSRESKEISCLLENLAFLPLKLYHVRVPKKYMPCAIIGLITWTGPCLCPEFVPIGNVWVDASCQLGNCFEAADVVCGAEYHVNWQVFEYAKLRTYLYDFHLPEQLNDSLYFDRLFHRSLKLECVEMHNSTFPTWS